MIEVINTLSERPYDARRAYVYIVLSASLSASEITPAVVRKIYQLFAQADLALDDRRTALELLFFKNRPPERPLAQLSDRDAALSLVKDVLSLTEDAHAPRPAAFVREIMDRFSISQEQIAFLKSWTDWENTLLAKLGKPEGTVSEKDMPVELAKKATALGIPISTLYFSGSVVGLGAAGITSGLATIGSASGLIVLGLNPMTAGIVALIAGGIAIKKVLDASFPTAKQTPTAVAQRAALEREAQRLAEVRQRYVSFLQTDTQVFAHGRWWEMFTTRRRRRKRAGQLLTNVLAAELAADIGIGSD